MCIRDRLCRYSVAVRAEADLLPLIADIAFDIISVNTAYILPAYIDFIVCRLFNRYFFHIGNKMCIRDRYTTAR